MEHFCKIDEDIRRKSNLPFFQTADRLLGHIYHFCQVFLPEPFFITQLSDPVIQCSSTTLSYFTYIVAEKAGFYTQMQRIVVLRFQVFAVLKAEEC